MPRHLGGWSSSPSRPSSARDGLQKGQSSARTMFVHEKVMFEIYREAGYDRRYRVVYFTELDEHNKEQEIARAVAGEPYYDGFLRASTLEEAKRVVGDILDRLNRGEPLAVDEAARQLSAYES